MDLQLFAKKENDDEKEEKDVDLKELFKEFLLDWKESKQKKAEVAEVPVPPKEEKKEEEKKEEKKKEPGFLDWLFG